MSAKPRKPIPGPRRCASVLMRAMLPLAAGSFVAIASWPASAQSPPSGFEGRWAQEGRHCTGPECRRVYDFAPCGTGWCGVEVKEGGACGSVAFRLQTSEGLAPGSELTGRYERAPGAEAYTVRVNVRPPSPRDPQPASSRLVIVGNTGTTLELFRRTFPLHMVLQREGDAVCKANNSVS